MCTDMLKGANIEGEDEREETIQDMEGLFCCQNCATLHLISRVQTRNRLRFMSDWLQVFPATNQEKFVENLRALTNGRKERL